MSNDSEKKAPKDEEWKPKKKITMRFTKNDADYWKANDNVTMELSETAKEDKSDDSQ